MEKIIVIFFSLIIYFPLSSQNESETKWQISLNYAAHDADTRLFNFPEIPKKALLSRQAENPRTYQFGLDLTRKLFADKKLSLLGGVGLSSEVSTFERPFDHRYRSDRIIEILIFTNRYYQNLLQLPIRSSFKVLKGFGINLEVLPQFNFLTVARHSKGKINFKWWRFDFYSLEINPGLEWAGKRLYLGMKYRAFQLKIIDRILFSYFTLDDDREDETFEPSDFNPFKLWFSVGYKF